MGVLIDGSGGMHIIRGDVSEYVPPHTVRVNERDLYLFDQSTGALSISASPEDCEFIVRKFGIGLDTPIEVSLPGPVAPMPPIRFPGVCMVASIEPPEGEQWLFEVDRT